MIQLGISKLRAEKRQQLGAGFTDAVVRVLEAQAAGSAVGTGTTAAVEAASGALSRAFAAAEVSGPAWAVKAASPGFLAQVGRDLVRRGESLHVIEVRDGKVSLMPAASWHFEGGAHPDTWMVRATVYGPSESITRYLPYSGVVFATWGGTPGQPYTGVGPLSWAATTARMQSETERSLADEAGGPITNLLPVPQDGATDPPEGETESADDPLAPLRADIRAARGKALLVETTAGAWGEGASAAPRQDWKAQRLGPNPPASMGEVLGQGFLEVLAACGVPPGMFVKMGDSGQREAYRRWCALVVQPMGRLLAAELSTKLEADIGLEFSGLYAHDLAGRARSFASMVQGGMDVTKAAGMAGLMDLEA